MAMHDFRAHVIHSAVQPSCPPRGSFGAAIEWPELESRVARGEPPLQPRARAPAQSSRNVQLAYLLCHARSVACACWMDVARPGFEPRACRDTFEPSSFERRAVTPLGQVYVTCTAVAYILFTTAALLATSELRVRGSCGGRCA